MNTLHGIAEEQLAALQTRLAGWLGRVSQGNLGSLLETLATAGRPLALLVGQSLWLLTPVLWLLDRALAKDLETLAQVLAHPDGLAWLERTLTDNDRLS
jgi:hypothetical protein